MFWRLRFGLLLAALVLAVLAWLVSLIPLWLVASTAINALFTVRHPLLALRLGGAAPETAWGEHGAREMHEHLSAFCVAALLPLLLWVAPERALVSVARALKRRRPVVLQRLVRVRVRLRLRLRLS